MRPAGTAIVVGVYVAVVLLTLGVGAHRLLPLFDSIGPTPAYRWVRPPGLEAVGNQAPAGAQRQILLVRAGLPPASASTDDGQFVITVGAGALAPHGVDTSVSVRVAPVDPGGLPPLPAGWRADGNAYRVTLTYLPSGQPVTATIGGNVVLQVPQRAAAVLHRSGESGWVSEPTEPAGGPAFAGGAFAGPGYYLAATTGPSQPVGGGTTRLSTLALAGAVAGLAVLLGIGPALLRLRR